MNDNLDNDSIRTEDYASKFNETINLPGGKCLFSPLSILSK